MYQLTADPNIILRLSDNTSIPLSDPDGAAQKGYAAWLAEGNTPQPYIAPPPAIPQEVTMRQARLALLADGLLANVDTAIEALPEPDRTVARISWDYSSAVQRRQPWTVQLAAALGLSDEQIDQLFVQAAAL